MKEKIAETIMEEKKDLPAIPFIVQPGFSAPEGAGRVLFAFGTSTVTTVVNIRNLYISIIFLRKIVCIIYLFFFFQSTSTYSVTLTAICSSTTGYPTCVASG